jgi:hypothetical protein
MTSGLYTSANRAGPDDETAVLEPIEAPPEDGVNDQDGARGMAGEGQAWNGIAPGDSGPPGLTTVSVEPRWRRVLRALRTFAIVLLLLGAAGAGGLTIARDRLDARAYQDLGGAVLTAPPVPVGASSAATVGAVYATEQSHVMAGQALADVNVESASGRTETQTLRAPSAGTVLQVNLGKGGVAGPGQAIVTLYDPAKLTFQVKVDASSLRHLRLGMTTYLTGPGLAHQIRTRLDHVIPQVGNDAFSSGDRLTVVLVPKPADVGTLVPGLSFDATVDLRTAPGSVSAVNSAG